MVTRVPDALFYLEWSQGDKHVLLFSQYGLMHMSLSGYRCSHHCCVPQLETRYLEKQFFTLLAIDWWKQAMVRADIFCQLKEDRKTQYICALYIENLKKHHQFNVQY